MPGDSALRATRTAYDAVAADYARLLPDLSIEAPLDRAVLTAFVELVVAAGNGPIVEVGCGTGRIAAHLADAGLHVIGMDLSPRMAQVASAARPDLSFAVAHAGALPVRSGALGGVLAWYSLINLPTRALAQVAAELARVTRPGAPVLVAFQCGNGERVDRTSSYGRDVPLTYYRHRTDDVAQVLGDAGLALQAAVQREPQPSRPHESTPHAFLLAQLQP